MKTLNRFYTYAYLRKDKTPYYIGKGLGDRLYKKFKYEISPPKDKSKIIFLKQNLSEEEAFKHEIYMIAVLGRKDLGTGILRNKTNGGEGVSGIIRSKKTRIKNGEVRKGRKWWNNKCGSTKFVFECPGPNWVLGRSEEFKRKKSMLTKGEKNPQYGKKDEKSLNYGKSYSEEHKRNMSEAKKGRKWWNDGCGNMRHSIECPGPNWVLGRGKRKTETI